MLSQIRKFALDERGLETIEWAIIGGVIAAGATLLFFAIGQDAARGFTSMQAETADIP